MPPVPEPTYGELLWTPSMFNVCAFACLLFGMMVGSFLNVCIYRIPAGMSVNRPKRSFCFRCGSMIRWYENIPVFSWFWLRGKCGSCGAPFSFRYAAVELLTGLLFLAVFLGSNSPQLPFQWATVWYLTFTALLVVGTFTDLDHWIIPDGVTLGGAAVALGAALVIGLVDVMPLLAQMGPFPVVREMSASDPFNLFVALMQGPVRMGVEDVLWWEPFANAVLGAALSSGLLYGVGVAGKVLLRRDAMGLGDVKLYAMVGATLGVTGSLVSFFLACIFGAAAGLGMMAVAGMRGAGDRTDPTEPADVTDQPEGEEQQALPARIARAFDGVVRPRPVHHLPFGPWIALGAVAVLVFQGQILKGLQAWIF